MVYKELRGMISQDGVLVRNDNAPYTSALAAIWAALVLLLLAVSEALNDESCNDLLQVCGYSDYGLDCGGIHLDCHFCC